MLLNRLDNHILADSPMTSTQVDAAKFLINKVISNAPADTTVEHKGVVGFKWEM